MKVKDLVKELGQFDSETEVAFNCLVPKKDHNNYEDEIFFQAVKFYEKDGKLFFNLRHSGLFD